MTAKARLVAEIEAALAQARAGDIAGAEAAVRALAHDPQATTLGTPTALGLPRKLHSALVRLARIAGDPVRLAGLQATAVPPETVIGPIFAPDAALRGAMTQAAARPVPRLLHQIWVGGPPPVACAHWRDWAAAHGWAYRLWDEAALEAAGITADPVWRQMVAEGDLPGAVDVARYHILLAEGGLYLDCDWFPARPDLAPESLFPPAGLCVLAEPMPRQVAGQSLLLSNALIAAPAGHPALARLIAALPEVARRLPGAPAWWVTGPLAFTLALRGGPVTVLDPGLVAASLPRRAPLADVLARAWQEGAAAGPGALIAWKGW